MDLCLTSSSASPHELSIAVYHPFISLLLQTQYVPRIGGPQDHLQIWWVTRRTQHDSAYMSYSWLSFISLKGYNLISKKKPHEASPRKPGLNFQDISLSGVTQKALNSSSNELWHVWNVSQGSSLETQCSGFLLGDAHIGTQCLPCTKIPHSEGFQRKPYCLHKQFKRSVAFLWGNGKKPSPCSSSQVPAKGI